MQSALIGFLVVAVAGGLYARDLASFASPTLGHLAKKLAMGGVLMLIISLVIPHAWPLWMPYACTGIAAVGIGVYVANLPKRL